MKQYHNLLNEITTSGTLKDPARPGMPPTIAIFGAMLKFDLSKGDFPLLTTKKVSYKNILTELMWFLKGDTNVTYLLKNKCDIWLDDTYRGYLNKLAKTGGVTPFDKETFANELLSSEHFSDEYGDLGPTYGYQWRNFGQEVDQIKKLIDGLIKSPTSRRHIITAWDPTVVDSLVLPPCHPFVQFNTIKLTMEERTQLFYNQGGSVYKTLDDEYLDIWEIPRFKLDCLFYMRSVDTFLGLPYNIASYATLLNVIAKIVGMEVGELVFTAGDVHIYQTHTEQVALQLTRDVNNFKLPSLALSGVFDEVQTYFKDEGFELDRFLKDLDKDLYGQIEIKNYQSFPYIKAPLSVGI